jgi:membrane protein required for colicin V production
MNFFDIAVIVIVCVSLIRGLMIGLVRQLASIFGVLAGFYVAYSTYPILDPYLQHWIANDGHRHVASFTIIFCAVFFLVVLVAWIISYLMKVTMTAWLDKVLGVLFGALKGVLIVTVLFIVLTTFLPKGAVFLQQSTLAPYVGPVAERLTGLVTVDMKEQFRIKLDALRQSWNKL